LVAAIIDTGAVDAAAAVAEEETLPSPPVSVHIRSLAQPVESSGNSFYQLGLMNEDEALRLILQATPVRYRYITVSYIIIIIIILVIKELKLTPNLRIHAMVVSGYLLLCTRIFFPNKASSKIRTSIFHALLFNAFRYPKVFYTNNVKDFVDKLKKIF
jgi:hypothetical protein